MRRVRVSPVSARGCIRRSSRRGQIRLTYACLETQRRYPIGYSILLRLNHLQPPFNHVELGRAVLGAVDQTDFLQGALGNMDYAKVCKSFLPCGTPMSTGAGSEMMTGDLAAAKKAVAASGYDG